MGRLTRADASTALSCIGGDLLAAMSANAVSDRRALAQHLMEVSAKADRLLADIVTGELTKKNDSRN